MHDNPEQLLRSLARLLAPYVAEELARPQTLLSTDYDSATCEVFVQTLGTPVLERAIHLFSALVSPGKLSSLELALAIGAGTPRNIAGSLTTPLKRRARELNLPLPFEGGEGALPYGGIANPNPDADDSRRTYWIDRDHIAERMLTAIRNELSQRAQSDHTDSSRANRFIWKPGDLEVLSKQEAARALGKPIATPKARARRVGGSE